MKFIQNAISESEIGLLRELPEVKHAYDRLSTQQSVYFDIQVPETIRTQLHDVFGFETQNKRIPFRWIRGDTVPHVDRGSSSFENTYLVYLTDGEGEFQIGEESYPITAGSGFCFSEGTQHGVTGTNGTSRLLLGPMSESGFPVGLPSIYADGQTDTVYLSQSGGTFYYKINNGDLFEVPALPILITNSNAIDVTEYILNVVFTTDLTITDVDQYLYINSSGIQIGSDTLKPNGTKYTITVDGVTDYPGFVLNQNYSYTYVTNLHIAAINGSTLKTTGGYAGWVGQTAYGLNGSVNYIVGCSSDGPIPDSCGGIVGSGAATGESGLIINGCSSSGTIGTSAGGIVGASAGNVTINYCSSSGTIGTDAGGIVGDIAAQSASCTVNKSYSMGTIGTNAGGIFGANAGTNGSANASYCYSRGTIGTNGGGIFGQYAANADGTVNATQCYSLGYMTTDGNGIFGSDARTAGVSAVNCYVADANWSDSDADFVLSSSVYQSVGVNQPYELKGYGPSPYSLQTVSGRTTLVAASYPDPIPAGSSIAAVVSGFSSYSMLEIYSNENGDTSSITINPTTGTVSTTRNTPLDAYAIQIRSGNGVYTNTFLFFTVTEAPPLSPPSTTGTLDTKGKQFDNNAYTTLQQGQRFVIERRETPNLRFNSFADYNKYLLAQASFRK